VYNIAIIPARAGSKSIKNKNLVKIDGKETLVERTIRVAKESGVFRKIILSTDIPYLIEANIPEIETRVRPHQLCTDEALMDLVIADVIERYEISEQKWIWLLQPTSPFRTRKHFRDIQRIKQQQKSVKSIVSVQNVEAFHPNRMYTKKNDYIYRLNHTSFKNKQDLPNIYIRNGAFYVIRVREFLGKHGLTTRPCFGYEMSNEESINIDSKFYLGLAKFIEGSWKKGTSA